MPNARLFNITEPGFNRPKLFRQTLMVARAGKTGRGFKVEAAEVHKLAATTN